MSDFIMIRLTLNSMPQGSEFFRNSLERGKIEAQRSSPNGEPQGDEEKRSDETPERISKKSTVLQYNSNPEIHLYNKPKVLIGSDPNLVDLLINHKEIQPVHLTLLCQNGTHTLFNDHDDAFITVNGLPFGKKQLNQGDFIEIHELSILFESLATAPVPLSPSKHLRTVPETSTQESLSSHYLLDLHLPFEDEVKILDQSQINQEQLECYLTDLETATQPQKSAFNGNKKSPSLKDDYLRDLDDDNPHKDATFPMDEQNHLIQAWKWILLFIVSVSMISGLIGTVVYFSVSDKTDAEETKAAQAIADLSVALTHAQLNHLYFHNPNWSDTEFLKSNLNAILPDAPSYAFHIDPQGNFTSSPYKLRIYTSANLSHFLLIAQPEPSVMHWITPKAMIVVDSHTMELRTVKDVRSLNRLLANPDPLEGANSKEIASLVKSGGLITLQNLARDSGRPDFAPPRELAELRPGAENYIYNAPRYYRLGEDVMKKIASLASLKATSKEVASIKRDVANFCCLNQLVLYSADGEASAEAFRKGLRLYAPSANFLYGYITSNNRDIISQVTLLGENSDTLPSSSELVALNEPIPSAPTSATPMEPNVDINHPIYIKLYAKILERQGVLKPIVDELFNLVQAELVAPSPSFQIEYQNLSHHLLITDARYRRHLKADLDKLYLEYEEMPVVEFVAFVKALNLQKLIHESDDDVAISDENVTQEIHRTLPLFADSQSLEALAHLIHRVSTLLNFDHIKDSDDLVLYQNQLRNLTLAELEKHILLNNTPKTAEDRDILLHILDQERLIHSDEKEYFLEEFDRKDDTLVEAFSKPEELLTDLDVIPEIVKSIADEIL